MSFSALRMPFGCSMCIVIMDSRAGEFAGRVHTVGRCQISVYAMPRLARLHCCVVRQDMSKRHTTCTMESLSYRIQYFFLWPQIRSCCHSHNEASTQVVDPELTFSRDVACRIFLNSHDGMNSLPSNASITKASHTSKNVGLTISTRKSMPKTAMPGRQLTELKPEHCTSLPHSCNLRIPRFSLFSPHERARI